MSEEPVGGASETGATPTAAETGGGAAGRGFGGGWGVKG